jgi:hypothetical protein
MKYSLIAIASLTVSVMALTPVSAQQYPAPRQASGNQTSPQAPKQETYDQCVYRYMVEHATQREGPRAKSACNHLLGR